MSRVVQHPGSDQCCKGGGPPARPAVGDASGCRPRAGERQQQQQQRQQWQQGRLPRQPVSDANDAWAELTAQFLAQLNSVDALYRLVSRRGQELEGTAGQLAGAVPWLAAVAAMIELGMRKGEWGRRELIEGAGRCWPE